MGEHKSSYLLTYKLLSVSRMLGYTKNIMTVGLLPVLQLNCIALPAGLRASQTASYSFKDFSAITKIGIVCYTDQVK